MNAKQFYLQLPSRGWVVVNWEGTLLPGAADAEATANPATSMRSAKDDNSVVAAGLLGTLGDLDH
jgi:hypothetical protein